MRYLILFLLIIVCGSSKGQCDSLDFYYSWNHARHLEKYPSFGRNNLTRCYVKGKPYTECIAVGKEPMTKHFGDLKFVMRACMKDIKVSSEEYYSGGFTDAEIVWYDTTSLKTKSIEFFYNNADDGIGCFGLRDSLWYRLINGMSIPYDSIKPLTRKRVKIKN